MNRIETAFDLFDAYNQEDPNIVEWKGKVFPAEYFYSLQLHQWVVKLKPDAGEHLLLASRSQHIGRWKSPRSSYPPGKAGYLNWRKDLSRFHARTAGEIMKTAGYDDQDVAAVEHIILKEDLRFDEQVQVMENALCLVFLEFQFSDFVEKHQDDAMIIRIIKKTWKKMTAPGHNAALELQFNTREKELIVKALNG